MKLSSQSGEPEYIDLKHTCFTPDLEEDPRKTPSHKPSVAPDNINKMLMLLQSEPHVQGSPACEGALVSEVIGHPTSEGV